MTRWDSFHSSYSTFDCFIQWNIFFLFSLSIRITTVSQCKSIVVRLNWRYACICPLNFFFQSIDQFHCNHFRGLKLVCPLEMRFHYFFFLIGVQSSLRFAHDIIHALFSLFASSTKIIFWFRHIYSQSLPFIHNDRCGVKKNKQ